MKHADFDKNQKGEMQATKMNFWHFIHSCFLSSSSSDDFNASTRRIPDSIKTLDMPLVFVALVAPPRSKRLTKARRKSRAKRHDNDFVTVAKLIISDMNREEVAYPGRDGKNFQVTFHSSVYVR
jgi:hypothetical protein